MITSFFKDLVGEIKSFSSFKVGKAFNLSITFLLLSCPFISFVLAKNRGNFFSSFLEADKSQILL